MFNHNFKLIFTIAGIAIVVGSTIFTNRLANSLSVEEQKKIEIWAEATRQLVVTESETYTDFMFSIIEGNNTIPVIIADANDSLLNFRNIKEPAVNREAFFAKKIISFKAKNQAIEILFDDNNIQYIYYDDSLLLKQLYYFPYIQFAVIVIFLLLAYLVFTSSKRAEQNRVWVGLSKETAHQLGTPISSLLAWTSLLGERYPDDNYISEMQKDIERLNTIADRFSKIGSTPDLQSVNLNQTLTQAATYVANRSSHKVKIDIKSANENAVLVNLNVPLFEWVIENLCKNAIDAMNGVGQIEISTKAKDNDVIIDVKDNGKGIDRRKFKTVFKPGFTTKKRGWGLGLSLAKRIIEEYHHGKIFVKSSEINAGTTFRIVLKSQNANK
ncbi:MAG: HAMP domain-containing histidine kinase [Paludibacter sp.]|jgi:two-component sensor histidine kinase|nr:HAMP domain-containing histidine kinase [Paludibacter sp.]